jgi:hypothetical protein
MQKKRRRKSHAWAPLRYCQADSNRGRTAKLEAPQLYRI